LLKPRLQTIRAQGTSETFQPVCRQQSSVHGGELNEKEWVYASRKFWSATPSLAAMRNVLPLAKKAYGVRPYVTGAGTGAQLLFRACDIRQKSNSQ
jgi:hypothetical protein